MEYVQNLLSYLRKWFGILTGLVLSFLFPDLISQQPLGVAGEDWKAPEKESKPLDETVKVLH